MTVLVCLWNLAGVTPHLTSGNDNNHSRHHYKKDESSDSSSFSSQKLRRNNRECNNENQSPSRYSEKRRKSKKVTIIKHPTINSIESASFSRGTEEGTNDLNGIVNSGFIESSNSTIVKDKTLICNDSIVAQSLKNVKQINKKQSNASKKQSDGKDGASLRRIKREWKDAVKLGIAYDWQQGETVTIRGRSASGKSMHDDVKEYLKYDYIRIGPWGKSLLRWHFSVKGPSCSVYSKGVYHGRILLPKDYPLSPPRIQMLTPSGRFISGEDICLSASAFHPETWTPRWTILSLVDALRMHMLTTANEIGGIDASIKRRRQLALASRHWKTDYIDHGKMIKDGIFHDEDDLSAAQDDVMQNLTNLHAQDESAQSYAIKLKSRPIQSTIIRIMMVATKNPIPTLLLTVALYLMFSVISRVV
jgi:ubiquitin-protein ligase